MKVNQSFHQGTKFKNFSQKKKKFFEIVTLISSVDKHIMVFDSRANALCDIPPITARQVLKFCNSRKY